MSLFHRFRVAVQDSEILKTKIDNIQEGETALSCFYDVPIHGVRAQRCAVVFFDGHYMDLTFTWLDGGARTIEDINWYSSLPVLIKELEEQLGD